MSKLLFSVTIKDCKVDVFRCPGNGGQKVNKTSSGVRVTHEPSGAVGQSCDTRSQHDNKQFAFQRMSFTPEFRLWHRLETARRLGQPSIEDIVDDQMKPSNLKVDVQDEKGRWTPDATE
jgi:protein subunit release factor A